MSTSRRRFLTSLATACIAPRLLGRESGPVIVGEGRYRYRFNDLWAKLPPQIQWGLTHGVVVDHNRFVHVFHTSRKESPSKDCVVVFDPKGNFVRSWGAQFFGGAHGFDLTVEDGREVLASPRAFCRSPRRRTFAGRRRK